MVLVLLVTLAFIGIIMIVANEVAYQHPTKIVYRYLPRDLDDYIRTSPTPSTVYGAMFSEKDVI